MILCNAGKPDYADTVKDFPIRQFHGEKDPDHPIQAARDTDAAMQAAGATKYEFTELPGEGHIIHPTVYGNVDNLEWLFEQVRE